VVVPPPIPWSQKIGWIVRLEDQRLIRDPDPPPPAVLREATETEPAVFAHPAPADLITLLEDADAPVRRRAALAVGRVGLPEGVEPVARLLDDREDDVREMAAFALGLLRDPSARPALTRALADNAPIVRGRAAQALGLIGNREDAGRVAAMVRLLVDAGVLSGLDPDDISYPLSPSVEAVRLGIYALARLGSYEWLAAAVIGPDGDAVTRWWPVAYALGRIPGGQSAPVLLRLLDTPGRYTAAFAAKGLAAGGASPAVEAALLDVVARRRAQPAVVVQALRTLAVSGTVASAPVLTPLLSDRSASPALRGEAAATFGALAGRDQRDWLIDLLVDGLPAVRAAAIRGLARVDPDTFLAVLAGLDADDHWTVRVAQAQALGSLPAQRGLPRLRVMLTDADVRVVPAVVAGLAAAGGPAAEALVVERLSADDFVARAAAATALADMQVAAAVPLLVEAYRAAARDDTYVARAAVLTALSRIDRQAARPLLEDALKDRDWAVRVRAAALLREHDPSAAAAPIRPAVPGRPIDDPEWQRIVMPPYTPLAYIVTNKGTIELELAITDAPLTTENFVRLARMGAFEGRTIHRMVPDFVVQDGDPRGDGEGGPGYTIRDEINPRPYVRGTVGMALDWEDTGGSQFFITHSPQPHLDARYTVFGQVTAGMDVVDALMPGDVIERVRIWDGVNEP
jgi:cyclophilin family peptidyl-prolyl cis-trans isomerase/HEAT repeat protein